MFIFVLKLILAFVLGMKIGEYGDSQGWNKVLTFLVFVAAWLGINIIFGIFGV